jgi:formate dehydrogenase major subunit
VALTRRDLLKRTVAAGGMLPLLGTDAASAKASPQEGLKTDETRVTRTICPYCSVGCGILLYTRDGELVTASGDPEHPINEGTLCSKGASVMNLRLVPDKNGKYTPNPRRVVQVLYRAPGASKWEPKSWDWAISRIAAKVKKVRDATFERKDSAGITVNRTFALAHVGSAALDNEENYALVKLMRSLGMVRVEHHARL